MRMHLETLSNKICRIKDFKMLSPKLVVYITLLTLVLRESHRSGGKRNIKARRDEGH